MILRILRAWFAAMVGCAAIAATAQTGWTVRNFRAGGDDLWGISNGSAGLVAVGTNGAILHSPAGQNWTRRTSGTADWLLAVTFGNGRYIAVGDHGRILVSTDGIVWSVVASSGTTQRLNNVWFANRRFVAVGEGGTILTSDDGATWRASSSGVTKWLRGLSWGAASETYPEIFGTPCWIATGESGTVLLSSDGSEWTAVDPGTTADLESVAFVRGGHSHPVAGPGGGNVIFMVTGQSGTVRLLNLQFSDALPFNRVNVQVTPLPSTTTERFRTVMSGPRFFTRYLIAATSSGAEEAWPVAAVSAAGEAYSYIGTSEGLSREALPLSGINGGTYFAPQDSFYVVGASEAIVRRDQIFNGRAGNLSTRGFVDQGEKSLIAGFYVQGDAPKTMLVRAVGPALSGLGVSGALGRPVLRVYDSAGRAIATNTGWSTNLDPGAVTAAGTRAGAFPFTANSADSALLLTLPPGSYTAQVSGAAGSSGVALVEIYDLDPRRNGIARTINLSSRGQVDSGENILIAGLNVQGPAWRQFLVRGVGPSLAKFGVANALTDPVVRLASTDNGDNFRFAAISYLDNNSAKVAAATTAAGAFPLDVGTKDVAVIATLPPGNYTFHLASESGGGGLALLEIYDLGLPPTP